MGGWDFSRIHLGGMPDYLTPGYRNSGEGRPVWKRPLFIIVAVVTVLVVVGAGQFLYRRRDERIGGSGDRGGDLTADAHATF